MCLAIPLQIIKIEGDFAIVSSNQVETRVGIHLVPNVKTGDYVLVHAGFAIQIIDEQEAQKTLDVFNELSQYNEIRK